MALFILLLLGIVGQAEGTSIDLSQYNRVYVSYENCVWSPYANGCGGDGGQSQYWYSALTSCYRANVAYTVYGVALDDSRTYKDGEECEKGNFIGSFFTTTGVEDFLDSMTQAGVSFSDNDNGDGDNSEVWDCEIISQGDGENKEDEYDYTANNRKMYSNTISGGLGCSNSHQFVTKTYAGAYCDERAELEVTDDLATLNEELEGNSQCVLIYDATTDANQQGNDQKDGNNGDLLDNSEACNIRLYPQTCPDPFGQLHSDARAVGQRMSRGKRFPIVRSIFSWIFLSVGVLFLGVSAWAFCNKSTQTEKRQKVSSTGTKWRAPFKREIEDVPREQATAAKSFNAATPTQKKRRFFRWFSRRTNV